MKFVKHGGTWVKGSALNRDRNGKNSKSFAKSNMNPRATTIEPHILGNAAAVVANSVVKRVKPAHLDVFYTVQQYGDLFTMLCHWSRTVTSY